MCLATPVKIKSKCKNQKSKIVVEGGKEVDISLVPDAKIGDWLLCHADLAVQKISESQALEVLELSNQCHHNH
jgi:hydrogenase expression/formation protein HypC